MKKTLTFELVSKKAGVTKLSDVQSINLFGQNLESIDIASEMTNIRVLTLTHNKITDLSPLSNCLELQELYLRKNNIEDISQIDNLRLLGNLRVLWLRDNPISLLPDYRQRVITILPNLYRLDENDVSVEERKNASLNKPIDKITKPQEQVKVQAVLARKRSGSKGKRDNFMYPYYLIVELRKRIIYTQTLLLNSNQECLLIIKQLI